MNRPSYKELWLDEVKSNAEGLEWVRDAVDGNAEVYTDEPYSEGEYLARKIMQMHACITELEEKQRWIPVSERLPEVYEKVIALAKDCMNVDWVLPKELREVGKGAFARLYNVTHWMPLPESPIVYGKEREE